MASFLKPAQPILFESVEQFILQDVFVPHAVGRQILLPQLLHNLVPLYGVSPNTAQIGA